MEQLNSTPRKNFCLQSRLISRRASGPSEKNWTSSLKFPSKQFSNSKTSLRHLNIPIATPTPKSQVSSPKAGSSVTPHLTGNRISTASSGNLTSKKSSERMNSSSGKRITLPGSGPSQEQVPPQSKIAKSNLVVLITVFIVVNVKVVTQIHQDSNKAGNNLFSNERPYQQKKRALVCNLVRNIIKNDIGSRPGASSALVGSTKNVKKGSQNLKIFFNDNVQTSKEPKSEASTPKNSSAIARIFSARKQSHGTLKVESNKEDTKVQEKGNEKKKDTSNSSSKLTIKNITVKRTPSLTPLGSIQEREGQIFGSRKSSKNAENSDTPNNSNKKPLKGTVICTGGGSTSEYSTTSGSFVKFNDLISQERDKIIQYNKLCIFVQIYFEKRLCEA